MSTAELAPFVVENAPFDFLLLGPTGDGRTGVIASSPRVNLLLLGAARMAERRRRMHKPGSGQVATPHPTNPSASLCAVEGVGRIDHGPDGRDEVFTFAWFHQGAVVSLDEAQTYFANCAVPVANAALKGAEDELAWHLAPLLFLCSQTQHKEPARGAKLPPYEALVAVAFAAGVLAMGAVFGVLRLCGVV